MILGKEGVLGIDIGSNSIKIVELQEVGPNYRLKNIGEAPIIQGSIRNKSIVDSDTISQTLSILLEDLAIEADDAAVSISGDPVLLKRVSLPHMSEAEIKKSIKWEVEKLNSGSTNDLSYDYDVLSSENGRDMIDVLIVAVNKNVTTDYLSILSNVGLNPVLIDLDVFSLQTVYEANYPESEGLLALVNIGASVTNVLVVENGESVFARDLRIGGDHYTDLIINEMDLSYDEAEEVKHSQRAGMFDANVERLTNDFIQLISSEITDTLSNFSTAHGTENVKRIMISGGSSTLPGFKDKLSEQAQSYVGILNPFRNIDYSEGAFDPEYIEDISPKMNIATGLALRIS